MNKIAGFYSLEQDLSEKKSDSENLLKKMKEAQEPSRRKKGMLCSRENEAAQKEESEYLNSRFGLIRTGRLLSGQRTARMHACCTAEKSTIGKSSAKSCLTGAFLSRRTRQMRFWLLSAWALTLSKGKRLFFYCSGSMKRRTGC